MVSQVAIDNITAARDLTHHLQTQGFHRIAAVGTPETSSSGGSRWYCGCSASDGGVSRGARGSGDRARPGARDPARPLEPGRCRCSRRALPEQPPTPRRLLLLHRHDCLRRALRPLDSRSLSTSRLRRRRLRQHHGESIHRPTPHYRRLRPPPLRRVGPRPARRADGRQERDTPPGPDPAPDHHPSQYNTLKSDPLCC